MNNLPTLNQIDLLDFLKVGIFVGTVISAELNPKAIKPAYKVVIDFGNLGIKISSAQITQNYTEEELVGQQIIAVLNFPPKKVAGINSEVLILAAVCEDEGTVLIKPSIKVQNGNRIL